MALIKYTPQFIERQYIPTNVNAAIDVMGKMQGQYDRALDTQQQALNESYGMKTGQGFEAGKNQFVENLKSQINQAIEKRGGDAGAALRDIQSTIINAKRDPFIRANEYNLDQIKRFQDAYDRDKNALVINDPNKIQYKPGMKEEDMNYSLLSPEDVRKMAQIDYAGEAGKRFLGIGVDPSGRYDTAKYAYGPDDNRIQQILNNPESLARLKQYYPQVQGMSPEKTDKFFKGVLESSLRSMQKSEETDVLSKNSEYEMGLKAELKNLQGFNNNNVLGSSGKSIIPTEFDEAYKIHKADIDNKVAQMAATIGMPEIKTLDQLEEASQKIVPTSRSTDAVGSPFRMQWGNNAAGELLKKIKSDVGANLNNYAYKTINLNPLASTDAGDITDNKKKIDNFNDYVFNNFSNFEPVTDKDRNKDKKITDKRKMTIKSIVPLVDNQNTSMIIVAEGLNPDTKQNEEIRYSLKRDPNLPPMSTDFERNLYGYLTKLPGEGSKTLGKLIYLKQLGRKIPNPTNDPRIERQNELNAKNKHDIISTLASANDPDINSFIKENFKEYDLTNN